VSRACDATTCSTVAGAAWRASAQSGHAHPSGPQRLVAGILLAVFGAFRLLTTVPIGALAVLALWMIGAVIIHDGIIAPATVGWLLGKVSPPRARRYVQTFLISGGLVTIIAIPLILRRKTQPASKAILQQNYAGPLTVLLGIIAGLSLLAYAEHVAHEQRPRTTNGDPSESPDGGSSAGRPVDAR